MHIPSGYDNDAQLLADLRQGMSQEQAFRRVIQAWQRPLYAKLRRLLGNHEDAADALQETFLKMHKGLGQFRGKVHCLVGPNKSPRELPWTCYANVKGRVIGMLPILRSYPPTLKAA